MEKLQQIKCKIFKEKDFLERGWKKYLIKASYKMDGNLVENEWIVQSESVFQADKWANIMIEGVAGSLNGVKKSIQKVK